MWVKFRDQYPKDDHGPIITRSTDFAGAGDCIECWTCWTFQVLKCIPRPTHWWNGEFDFEKSLKAWDEQEENKKEKNCPSCK